MGCNDDDDMHQWESVGENADGFYGLKSMAEPMDLTEKYARKEMECKGLIEELRKTRILLNELAQGLHGTNVRLDFEDTEHGGTHGYNLDPLDHTKSTTLQDLKKKVLATGMRETMWWTAIVDGGTKSVWHLTVTPLRAEGRITGLAVLHVDITNERKLTHDLREARSSAESASSAQSQFLTKMTTMSHEIRTPMNGIVGMSSILVSSTPLQVDLVKDIQTSADALLAVVNQITDFSKMEAGEVQFVPLDFNVATLLAHVEANANALKTGNSVHVELPPTMVLELVGDSRRLHQILTNLAGNAVKFTTGGVVTISAFPISAKAFALSMGTKKDEEPKEMRIPTPDPSTASSSPVSSPVVIPLPRLYPVRFLVSDTGMGIAESALAHIFLPYTQADSSTTRRFGGMGLGLAIVKTMAEMMGGCAGVLSTVGCGSSFWIDIPLQRRAVEIVPIIIPTIPIYPILERKEPLSLEIVPTVPIPILIAEDNIINQKVLSQMLRRLGHTFVIAEDGVQALDAVKTAIPQYELVLLDIHMPNLDGLGAATAIRKWQAEHKQTPVRIVAVTADSIYGAEPYLAHGMDGFMSKPVSWDKLKATLRSQLSPTSQALASPCK